MNPSQLLQTTSGSYVFGSLPDIADPHGTLVVAAGDIFLPHGNLALGLRHIERKHAAKIAHYHRHLSVIDYVETVARHFHHIYLQPDASLWLIKFNGVAKGAIVARHDAYAGYRVITAYPIVRLPDFARRGTKLIFRR